MATFFLALLWFSWLFSSLLAYWGARKTAARVLYVFGAVVLAFAIVSNLGSEWSGWAALLLHPLLALPFLGLAYVSGRSPRVAGVFLVAVSLAFFFFFVRRGNLRLASQGVTFVLFIGPLLASGIALLAGERADGEPDETEQEEPAGG